MRPNSQAPADGQARQQVVVRQALPTSPERAFALFTNGPQLATWFCSEAESEEKLGGALHATWHEEDGESYERLGRFAEWQPPHMAVVEWLGGASQSADEAEPVEIAPDIWRLAIAPAADGCIVTVVSPLLRSEAPVRADILYETAKMGWEAVFQTLRELLAAEALATGEP